jgi:hypothetical protein
MTCLNGRWAFMRAPASWLNAEQDTCTVGYQGTCMKHSAKHPPCSVTGGAHHNCLSDSTSSALPEHTTPSSLPNQVQLSHILYCWDELAADMLLGHPTVVIAHQVGSRTERRGTPADCSKPVTHCQMRTLGKYHAYPSPLPNTLAVLCTESITGDSFPEFCTTSQRELSQRKLA